MSNKKSKLNIALWILGLAVAVIVPVCMVPLTAWFYYPYSLMTLVISFPLYLASVILSSVLYLKKRKQIYQTVAFILFSLPILAFATLFISIGTHI